MKRRWKRGQTLIAVLCTMLLIVTVACGSGDDDDNDSTATPAATSTATTAASAADTSPTATEEDDSTATTAAASPTATETEEPESTATTGSRATATTPAGETETATSTTSSTTATEPAGSTSTTGVGDVEVPDFETLDPELLPNFTLTMNLTSTNMQDVPTTEMKMLMEQSDPETYHVSVDTDGEVIEFWSVDGKFWTSIGGEVVESPTGALFRPSDFLTLGGVIPDDLDAREVGHEEINGRQTTHWTVDGDDYVAYMNQQAIDDGTSTGEMTDGSGQFDLWIDDELKILIKAESNVTWKNEDGTDGSLAYDYEIHDIGSTAAITAPQ